MKNLENYGVQEMNTKEFKKINGGDLGLSIALVALGIAVMNTDWDKAADSISRGWNSI